MKIFLLAIAFVLFSAVAAGMSPPYDCRINLWPMTKFWSVKDPCDWEVQHAAHFAAERLPYAKLRKAALMTVIYAQVNRANRIHQFRLEFLVRTGLRDAPHTVWICRARVGVKHSLVLHKFHIIKHTKCKKC